MRAVTITATRRIFVAWHWSAAAYFYFVSTLSLIPATDMSLYGLLAAVILGVATIVARSNAYASCMRSASKNYAARVASPLNKLSAIFG